MKATTRTALEIFVEKARKLASNRLVEQPVKRSIRWSWKQGDSLSISRGGAPDQESIDAFVLNLRFFIQENEPSSFKSLAGVLDDGEVSVRWKSGFIEARDWLNQYLDSRTDIGITLNDYSPKSRREVMDICVYGEIAHSNLQKRGIFRSFASEPLLASLFMLMFEDVLLGVFGVVLYVANLSAEELGQQPIV